MATALGVTKHDKSVMATGDDAAVSKLSAVQLGYFEDPFIKHMVSKPTRRAPLINRGYYSRVKFIRKALSQFLDSASTMAASKGGKEAQVVCLGAGMDTAWWCLKQEGKAPGGGWFEVDFRDVVESKRTIAQRVPDLSRHIGGGDSAPFPDTGGQQRGWGSAQGARGGGFRMAEADLRDGKALEEALEGMGVDFAAPTMLISECVLIYMPPSDGTNVIKWAAKRFEQAVMVTYEQVHPDDPFGQTMVKNIAARGCPLLALGAYPDCAAQVARYTQGGWEVCESTTMKALDQAGMLDGAEAARVAKLEWLDEVEELFLIQNHYCITVASKGALASKVSIAPPQID